MGDIVPEASQKLDLTSVLDKLDVSIGGAR
jgi:hypothetical protein